MKELDRGRPSVALSPEEQEAVERAMARVARSGSRYISVSVQQVLVLNASYEPLNVCSLRRAHVLVFKGKAEVIEELDRPLCSATATFPWPHVIRLVHYVRVPRIVQRKISRRALFARDGWRCVYCGTASGRLTLDHVDPALARRRVGLGERRHLVRAVQPAQGEPAAARGADGAPAPAAAAGARALHPPRDAEDPEAVGAVPRRVRLDVDRCGVARPEQSSRQMKRAETGPPSHAHGEEPYASSRAVTSTRSRSERTAQRRVTRCNAFGPVPVTRSLAAAPGAAPTPTTSRGRGGPRGRRGGGGAGRRRR